MREIVDADDNDDVSPDTMTPDDNSDLILGGDLPEQTPESLWPDAAHVFRLWQIFLDRVNPLTKIIHVPTLQPYLAAATSGSQHVPRNIEALLFSIYLMAVISLTADECQALLGYSREEALQRFSSGVRLSLLRMGFLKTHDLTTLQALVIYLVRPPSSIILRSHVVANLDKDFPSRSVQSSCSLGSQRCRDPNRTKDGASSRRRNSWLAPL